MGRTGKSRLPAAAALAALLALAAAAQPAAGHWQPRPTTKPWQLQLRGGIDTSVEAPVFAIDGLAATRHTVRRLHRLRRRVICHFEAPRAHRPAAALRGRLALCARKGFDAVVAGGLEAGLRLDRWFARQAHRRGMAAGLENSGRRSRRLVHEFDFAIAERCFQRHSCGRFKPFIRHRKAVFAVELDLKVGAYCATARRIHFSAIGKSEALMAKPWRLC